LVFNVAAAAALLVSLIPPPPPVVDPDCVFDCGAYFVDSWEVGTAPYTMILGVAILGSSVAGLFGSRTGRTALLMALAAFVYLLFFSEVRGLVDMMLPAHEREVGLPGALAIWWKYTWLPAWLCVAVWLALTFWCLLGQPSSSFYTRRQASSGHRET
jgi:hypothetical protein